MKFYMAHDEDGRPIRSVDQMSAGELQERLAGEIEVMSSGMTEDDVREQMRIQLLIVELGL